MSIKLVVGLGQLGKSVVNELYELGAEVAVLDKDRIKVESIRNRCAMSAVVDAENQEALESLIPVGVDGVVIDLGGKENPYLNVLVTRFYHSKMIPRIITLAYSYQHAEILKLAGATEAVLPEREAAARIARTLVRSDLSSFLPVSEDFAVAEMLAPESFHGKKLGELHVRKHYGVTIVAFKIKKDEDDKSKYYFPEAEDIVHENMTIVVVGPQKKILKLH